MTFRNEKGSATAPTVPSLGSTHPRKDQEMNECTCNTLNNGRPRRKRPTDSEIADAVDLLLGDVQLLQIAAMVCDEHVCNELSGSKFGKKGESLPYWLAQEQVNGITYMTDHVRTLALNLQRALDKAFGLGDAA